MDKNSILQYKDLFDSITRYIESEDAAVDSCKSQHISVDDYFREVTKMVKLGSGSKREWFFT